MRFFTQHNLIDRPPRKPEESQPTYLTSHDGLQLYYRLHHSDGAGALLWLLEGLGGAVRNADDPMLTYLTTIGYDVVEFHPRGSGYSQGPRGDVEDFEVLLADYDQFLRFVRERNVPRSLVLVGWSMGGAMAADVLARNSHDVAGVILINPAFRYTTTVGPSFSQILRYGFNWLFRRSALSVDMMASIDSLTGEDLQEARKRVEDPMIVRYASLRYLSGVRGCMQRLLNNARHAQVPLLLLYGENDPIIDHTGSQEIYDTWGHGDKEIILLPGCGHGESASRAAQPFIGNWLSTRFPSLVGQDNQFDGIRSGAGDDANRPTKLSE